MKGRKNRQNVVKDQGCKPEEGRIGREKSAMLEDIHVGSATKTWALNGNRFNVLKLLFQPSIPNSLNLIE